MKQIATHKAPDADAIVAAWLAAKYLFDNQAEVVFRGRQQKVHEAEFDCVVDIGNRHDPERLWFDHKPPAFTDRNVTCAAKLVWQHLLARGHDVAHLAPLVQVVFEGDTRKWSPALAQSRLVGPHAALSRIRQNTASDSLLYTSMAAWLDAYEQVAGAHT